MLHLTITELINIVVKYILQILQELPLLPTIKLQIFKNKF
jgi:hypothetical protein